MTKPFDARPIFESFPPEPRFLLPLLQKTQELFKHIPPEAVRAIALYTGVPKSRVFSLATFYAALSLEPKGDKIVRVCRGTACHLRGSDKLAEALEKKLRVKLGQTSPDGAWTLEGVNCVGACAMAPVVTVDDEIFSDVKADALDGLLHRKEARHAP